MAGGVTVAVVLLLCLGDDHGSTLGQNCDPPDAELVTEGNKKTVSTKESEERSKSVQLSLYVHPGSDFKGVSLEVTQSMNGHVVAWFAVDECYEKDTKWIQLGVDVKSTHIKNTLPKLEFNISIGNCRRSCIESEVGFYIHSLRLVAHGSSKWTSKQLSDTCLAAPVSGTQQNPTSPDVCTQPPSPITTTSTATTGTSTTTPTATANPPGSVITTPTATNAAANPPGTAIIIPTATQTTTVMCTPSPTPVQREVTQSFSSTVMIIVPTVMVAAIVVTVLTCVVNWRRRRRLQEATQIWRRQQSDPATPRDSTQVRENSLYEPFSGPSTLATREQRETVVRENSLYESFSGPLSPAATREQQEPVYVNENSLYEPFSGPPIFATREQHETVVRENSLYESFSGP